MQRHGLARTPMRLTINWRRRSSRSPVESVPNSSTTFCPWQPLINWPVRHPRWRLLLGLSHQMPTTSMHLEECEVRHRHSMRGANSWETGYHFAAALRASLNGGTWKSHSLDELAGHLSIDQLDHCLLPEAGECRFLDALTGSNQRHNPKFLIEKKREDSRQFAFCRALFEHLTSPPGLFAAVSGLRTDRQQMNRAFAAEFLAPHQMLKSDLSGAVIGEDEINDLAIEYGVSAFVVRHQIENHRLARISL